MGLDEYNKKKVVSILYMIMTTGLGVIVMAGVHTLLCVPAIPMAQFCVSLTPQINNLLASSGFQIGSAVFSITSGVTGYIISCGKNN